MSSSRAKKVQTRAAMKERRSGLRFILVQRNTKWEVHNVVDENEYNTLVEARREREEFAVNDDGLGYHDDGEETYSDQEHNNAKRQSAVATLNKARRDKALHNKKASSNALDKKDEGGKNQSMWNPRVRNGIILTCTGLMHTNIKNDDDVCESNGRYSYRNERNMTAMLVSTHVRIPLV